MKSNPSCWVLRGASAALLMSACTQLHATAYSISEYIGSSSLGRSKAGGAAIAEDASTVFTNPAGLTRLSDSDWLVATQIFAPTVNFHNKEGTHDPAKQSIKGDDGGNAAVLAIVPSFYYAKSLSEQWSFGFGMNSPFGLAVDYGRNWVGRYQVVEAKIQSINLNPSVGFKVNDALSIGGGINLQYAQLVLSQAVYLPGGEDGFLELDGDDWGWGFNFGVLWSLNANTRVGMAYRSKIKYTFKGDADYQVPSQFQAVPALADTEFHAPLYFPDHLSLSLYHQLTSSLAVMTDFTYTHWSRYKKLELTIGDQYNEVPKNWHNTWRVAVGLDYTYSKPWSFQAGLAFDDSPIPDETFDPSVPSSDQAWLSLGAQYQYSDTLSIGFAYLHVFIVDKRDTNIESQVAGRLHGQIEGSIDVIGAELNWRF